MYLIILTYQKDLNEVEKHLEAHRAYLDKHYASGYFVASGAQVPRTGGVILCKASNTYQIIEFTPTKYSESFGKVLS